MAAVRWVKTLLMIIASQRMTLLSSRYYNWTLAAPLILCMQAFQKNMPKVPCFYCYSNVPAHLAGFLKQ